MDITNYNNINLIRDIYDLDEVFSLPQQYSIENSVGFNKLYLDVYLIKEYHNEKLFIEMDFYENGVLFFRWHNSIGDFKNFIGEVLYGGYDEIIMLEEFLEFSSLRGHKFIDKYDLR